MTTFDLLNELENRGYKAKTHTVFKNGREIEAITVFTGNRIAPTVYPEMFLAEAEECGLSVSEVVDQLEETVLNVPVINIDLERLQKPEFVLQNIRIGIQRVSSEPLVKADTEFSEIEKYLYIAWDDYFIKVKKGFLDMVGVKESDAWNVAEKNTFLESRIMPMGNALSELTGVDIPKDEVAPNMFIVSNKQKRKGASAILDPEIRILLADQLNTKRLVVLPSSVHEVIVVPFEDEVHLETLSQMVREINDAEVSDEDVLANRAYMIEV